MQGPPRKGIVTIAFDDAYSDTYKYAIPYLNKLKIKSTIAVPAGLIEKIFEGRAVAGLKELKSMATSGHEIASHTLTHPNLLRLNSSDEDAVISEIVGSKRKLESLLPGKIDSFVFPYIKQSQSMALRLKARGHYKSVRLTSERASFNKIPIKDPYKLLGFAIMKKHSLSYLKGLVDYTAKNKRWLIEVFHLVSKKNTLSAHRPKPYRFFMHIDDFKRHVDYLLSKNITIATQKDGVKWTTKISRHRR